MKTRDVAYTCAECAADITAEHHAETLCEDCRESTYTPLAQIDRKVDEWCKSYNPDSRHHRR